MSPTVKDPAMRLADLLDLLDDCVVVRPNGDTFQVVRENGGVRCLPVDVDALVASRPRSALARPLPALRVSRGEPARH